MKMIFNWIKKEILEDIYREVHLREINFRREEGT